MIQGFTIILNFICDRLPKSFIKDLDKKTFATLRKFLLSSFNIKSQFNLQVPKPRFKLNGCAASNLTKKAGGMVKGEWLKGEEMFQYFSVKG